MIKLASSGFLFAVASMLFLGVSNFFYKKSAEALGPTNSTFYYYLFSLILASVAWFFFGENSEVPANKFIWPVLLAISLFLSVWTFNYAVKSLELSVASTIRGLFFLVPVCAAPFLIGERLGWKELLAVVFAILSIILFGMRGRA